MQVHERLLQPVRAQERQAQPEGSDGRGQVVGPVRREGLPWTYRVRGGHDLQGAERLLQPVHPGAQEGRDAPLPLRAVRR